MTIQLLFAGTVSEEDVVRLLVAPDSGFEIDPHAPLQSTAEFAVAVAGLVLSAAQLAVSLIPLLESKPDVHVAVQLQDGTTVRITGKDVRAVEVQLAEYVKK